MNNLLLLTSVLGFAPAIAIMWLSLRKYDYPYVQGTCFDDRRVFFLLAIGMVAGTILLIMERFMYPLFLITDTGGETFFSPVLFFLVYVIGLALVNALAKYIILNFPAIQGRIDSPFYGVSLGAGISSTWIVGFGFVSMASDGGIDALSVIALLGLSFNTAMINISAGAVLGASTARKEGMSGLVGGIVPHLAFNTLMFPWFYFDVVWYTLAIATPVSIIIYREIYTRIIPNSLPEEIREEIRQNEEKMKSRR